MTVTEKIRKRINWPQLKRLAWKTFYVFFSLFALFQLYVLARLYLFASCVIPTWSMSPTLIRGDYLIASLQIPGRREWQKDGQGGYTVQRKEGQREVRTGDVVVFNFPYARSKERMTLCNDLFYCKRCVATPGQEYGWWWKGRRRSLYLPAKGDEIPLDSTAWKDYRRCIEYETRQTLSLRGDTFKNMFLNMLLKKDCRTFAFYIFNAELWMSIIPTMKKTTCYRDTTERLHLQPLVDFGHSSLFY